MTPAPSISPPAWPLADRIACARRFRHALADAAMEAARAALPPGTPESPAALAEALTTQVIPLAEAARFLERRAARLLRPRRLGAFRQPLWLAGVRSEIHREPVGRVLILAPSNYPLFLPGVQALQALVAGNAVVWKPAPGGEPAARFMADRLARAGLPDGVLSILPTDPAAVPATLDAGIDLVVLTGSADTGTAVFGQLAPRLIPSIMELSGCDAVFIRHDADLDLAARAIAFATMLNSGRTCIGPHRLFVHAAIAGAFRPKLAAALDGIGKISAPQIFSTSSVFRNVQPIYGDPAAEPPQLPLVVQPDTADHPLTKTDLFTQIMTWHPVASDEAALAENARCPFALGASVFSRDEAAARALAARIPAGVVTVNDLVVPTADARIPFGGRGRSGFGVTRGAEGLLAFTVPKTIQVRRGRNHRHLEPDAAGDPVFFQRYLEAAHKRSLPARLRSVQHLIKLALRRR